MTHHFDMYASSLRLTNPRDNSIRPHPSRTRPKWDVQDNSAAESSEAKRLRYSGVANLRVATLRYEASENASLTLSFAEPAAAMPRIRNQVIDEIAQSIHFLGLLNREGAPVYQQTSSTTLTSSKSAFNTRAIRTYLRRARRLCHDLAPDIGCSARRLSVTGGQQGASHTLWLSSACALGAGKMSR